MSTHFVYTHTFRGLLTGKFHRGQPPPDPSSSRVAWVEADKQSRTNQSHPNLSEYADKEQFWELLDVMRQIADSHGKRQCSDSGVITPASIPEEVQQDHMILDGPSFSNINCHSKIGNLL